MAIYPAGYFYERLRERKCRHEFRRIMRMYYLLLRSKKAIRAGILFFLIMGQQKSFAQHVHDSAYYKTFPNVLTVRVYTVKDYADFSFASFTKRSGIQYQSNATTNLGAGVTYKNLSGNFSAGFGFLNNGIEERGKTSTLDLQFHFFPHSWISDLIFLSYKGFHASQEYYPHQLQGSYYYRPDVSLSLLGLSAYRVQHPDKFSYRTAFYQNEWLKKSSGTLLYGGAIYYQSISADSSLIPAGLAGLFANRDFNQFHFISVGPGIGYAHSLVLKQHFYLLGSAIINANIVFSTDENDITKNTRTGFEPALNFKTAAGYSGNDWNVSLSWAGNVLLAQQAYVSKANIFPVSEVRLTLAKQITLKKPIPVLSNVIDKIFGKEE